MACVIACTPESSQNSENELPYYKEATFTPQWLGSDSAVIKEFHGISPFSLFNQDGNIITEKTLKGKICVVDFFFTSCPGICPKMTSNMAVLQDEFLYNDNVLLLSHSVTPELDSISVLKDYALAKGIVSTRWYLLTGEREMIYDLGRNNYFVEEDLGLEKTKDDFLHTENFVLIDQNLHIRGIYNGLNKTSINQLMKDIKVLELGLK